MFVGLNVTGRTMWIAFEGRGDVKPAVLLTDHIEA
jgi:hypothetical protein